jgi:hypothetical protein
LSAIDAFPLRIRRKNTPLLLIVKRRAWRESMLAGDYQAVRHAQGLNSKDKKDEPERP